MRTGRARLLRNWYGIMQNKKLFYTKVSIEKPILPFLRKNNNNIDFTEQRPDLIALSAIHLIIEPHAELSTVEVNNGPLTLCNGFP